MYVTEEVIAALEARYGRAQVRRVDAEFTAREVELMDYCLVRGRAHDVTLLIHPRGSLDRFAVIRKPSYPPDVFRPPSGGVEAAEDFVRGAQREALEETGLAVRLERYLLRVDARFTCDGKIRPWTTHVFSAETDDETVEPRDLHEIAEGRWATTAEIYEELRPAMLRTGSSGFAYRLMLQDTALDLLGVGAPTEAAA
jgi:8-oxo-dGTP pyrophosphatase MutT (NUDIX family)